MAIQLDLHHVTADSRESLITTLIQEQLAQGLGLNISQVDISESLNDLGLDSIIGFELKNRIAQKLGVDIPIIKILDNATVESLTKEVLIQISTIVNLNISSELVPLQIQGKKTPLFFVHPLAGVIFPYYKLATILDSERPFYGLQSVGLENQERPLTSIQEMARAYIQALKKVQPSGPYYLGGWSLGAYIAWEIALQLTETKEEVAFLGVLDIYPPAIGRIANFRLFSNFLFTQGLLHIWAYIYDFLGLQSARATQNQQYSSFLNFDSNYRRITQFIKKFGYRIRAAARLLRVLQANTKAMSNYVPPIYKGKITLLRTHNPLGSSFDEPTLGWDNFVKGGVEVHLFPGNHFTLLRQPYVEILAQQLKNLLDKAEFELSLGE